jgi:hypothetical protein
MASDVLIPMNTLQKLKITNTNDSDGISDKELKKNFDINYQ